MKIPVEERGKGKFGIDGKADLKMLRAAGRNVTKKRELSVVNEIRDVI